MPPQIPDDNELVMNIMFMLASLNRHGLQITNMQQLNASVRQLAPFVELRKLFGQTSEPLYHVRITSRDDNTTEVALHHGTQQMCLDYAKNAMNILDSIGERFMAMQSTYHVWRSQRYIVYVVPSNFKL